MNIFPKGSMTGEYSPTFDPIDNPLPRSISEKSVVVVDGFGFRYSDDGSRVPGPVNEALAGFIEEHFSNIPLLTSPDAAPAFSIKPAEILDIESTDNLIATLLNIRDLGTVGVLKLAKDFMGEKYTNAIIVAQAYHVTRIGRLATKLGIDHDIPKGLPTDFDPLSAQPWIQSEAAWQKREKPTILLFTALGRMAFHD